MRAGQGGRIGGSRAGRPSIGLAGFRHETLNDATADWSLDFTPSQ
jgi:hypothetical protein